MINIILPNAFYGIRKNSNKPKICVEFIDSEPLYEKQIKTIKKVIPNANITYILGFHANKVENKLKELGCDVICNEYYDSTNAAFSIALGLEADYKNNLVIYGDLYFAPEVLENIPIKPSGSYLIKDAQDSFSHKNIGIGPNKFMDFVFQDKWSQILFLNKNDSEHFYNTANKANNIRKFSYEIINEMNKNGAEFDVIVGSGYIREIDRIKDLNEINRYLYKSITCNKK